MIELYRHLGDVPRTPPATAPPPGRLGSMPRGFFEEATPGRCDDASPAFLRGLLMPRADYDAMPMSVQLKLHLPPRWALYGGPIATRQEAKHVETYMQFWAQSQGLVWVVFTDSTPCVVASHRIPWPAQSGFAWTWVREVEYPRRVVVNKSTGKYVWEAPGVWS